MLKLDPNGEARDTVIGLRLTKTDATEIRRRAKDHGMSITAFIRGIALGEVDPAEVEDVLTQLRDVKARLDRVERLVSLGGID